LTTVLFTGCNAGYDITLRAFDNSDKAKLQGISYEVEAEGIESYRIAASGDWVRLTADGKTTYYNKAEKRMYTLNETEKKAFYVQCEEDKIPDPYELFYATGGSIAGETNVKWKKTGTKMIDGNMCTVYEGKGSLIDLSTGTLYVIEEYNVIVRIAGTRAGEQTEIVSMDIKNFKADVPEADVKIPDGYVAEAGQLQ